MPTINKLHAGPKGDPLNSSGPSVVQTVNSLVDTVSEVNVSLTDLDTIRDITKFSPAKTEVSQLFKKWRIGMSDVKNGERNARLLMVDYMKMANYGVMQNCGGYNGN